MGFKFDGLGEKLYGFFPAKCFHRDGIPNKGRDATQIMFQLNPSKEWSVNINLNEMNPSLNNKL